MLNASRMQRVYWLFGWFFDFTKLLTILFVYVLILHFFIITINIVQGDSMLPTFQDRDVVFVDRLTYRMRQPERGESVSFNFPGADNRKYIKRIVGLPGERVVIREGRLYINDKMLEESYLPAGTATQPDGIYVLDTNEYYVLGDFRANSLDSRHWGGLPKNYIIGRVMGKPSLTSMLSTTRQWVHEGSQMLSKRRQPSE